MINGSILELGVLCAHVSNVLNTSNELRPKSCKYQIIYEEEKSDSSILFLSFSLSLSSKSYVYNVSDNYEWQMILSTIITHSLSIKVW